MVLAPPSGSRKDVPFLGTGLECQNQTPPGYHPESGSSVHGLVYIHIYIYYIHACIHTYIYIYICVCARIYVHAMYMVCICYVYIMYMLCICCVYVMYMSCICYVYLRIQQPQKRLKLRRQSHPKLNPNDLHIYIYKRILTCMFNHVHTYMFIHTYLT